MLMTQKKLQYAVSNLGGEALRRRLRTPHAAVAPEAKKNGQTTLAGVERESGVGGK